MEEFEKLDLGGGDALPAGIGGYPGYGPGNVLSWPYYGLGAGWGTSRSPVTYDKVPLGEVAVRRGEQVHATDGGIGQVQGLVIDPGDHHVTHVLLQEGHLWGRKDVAIPITAVTGVTTTGSGSTSPSRRSRPCRPWMSITRPLAARGRTEGAPGIARRCPAGPRPRSGP